MLCPKIRNKTRCPLSQSLFNFVLEIVLKCNKARKSNKTAKYESSKKNCFYSQTM